MNWGLPFARPRRAVAHLRTRPGSGVFRLRPGDPPLVVGRGRSAAIRFDDPAVSREHAILEWKGDALVLRPVSTTSGTRVDGHRILEERPVRDGETILLGSSCEIGVRIDLGAAPRAGVLILAGCVVLAAVAAGIVLRPSASPEGGGDRDLRVIRSRIDAAVEASALETPEGDRAARQFLDEAMALARARLDGIPASRDGAMEAIRRRLGAGAVDLRSLDLYLNRPPPPPPRQVLRFANDLERKAWVRREALALLERWGEPRGSVPPDFLEEVDGEARRFMVSPRIRAGIERSIRYREMAERAFAAEKLPPECLWLALVESAFDPQAVSPAGAVGMWQFTAPTARLYGLVVDPPRGVDERLNPFRSAGASARLLADLRRHWDGDLCLALASYNAGPGAIQAWQNSLPFVRAGRFWELRNRFPETALYVPRVLAAAIVGANADLLGLTEGPAP